MTKDDVMDGVCPPSGTGFWMRPLGDMLIVRQAKEKRKRSVIIEEAASREMPWEGAVVALSPKAAEAGISLGDVVLFSRHAGQEGITPLGYDDTYVQLHADEILSVLDVKALEAMEAEYRRKEEEASAARRASRSGKLVDTGG